MSTTDTLASALAAFQAELPRVGKSSTASVKSDKANYTYKYADLAAVSATAMPLLGKHGLSFSAKPMLDENGKLVLRYVLRHANGDSDGGDFPLSQTARPQDLGSLITYARRYCLLAVTGLAPDDEDDDGAKANDLRIESHARPTEWDPAEQSELRDAWAAEIATATGEEIPGIGKRLLEAKRKGELSPNTYTKLAALGGRRKAELDAEAAK